MLPGRARVPFRSCGLALAAAAAISSVAACGSAVEIAPICTKPGAVGARDDFNRSVSLDTLAYGIKYGDISVGCGAPLHSGETVAVEYTAWLDNGVEFDSSRRQGGQPAEFELGAQQLQPAGLEIGVRSMRIGGHRRIVIPPAFGFGAAGVPPVIPANSTLIIDAEVIAASG
ncbi:MAG: FKBP-type peptidyl-prolyl cis-trans isomerase [Candidatus Dormibacteraeota bacterium]|nr:FKBP-type peptidyl-prolyl cis-trans isomerase [Candidatus Dormibacteraeota bacterium]